MIHFLKDFVFLLILLVGPVPLGLWVTGTVEEKSHRPSLSQSLIVLATVWCIISTVMGLLLGIAEVFTPIAVLAAELFLLLLGILLIYPQRKRYAAYWNQRFGVLGNFSDRDRYVTGIIVFLGSLITWLLLSTPIGDYDSLAYHLPTMAEWYREGSFIRLEELNIISAYPYGWEVICTLFIMPFRQDIPAALPNLLAWLLFALSVYRLGRIAGAGRTNSLTAAFLAISAPILLNNINTMHIDLPLGAFFLVCLNLIASYIQTRNRYYFYLLLPALGMLAGIKTSGLIYAVLLATLLGAALLKSSKINKKTSPLPSTKTTGQSLPFFLVCLLSMVLIGGFWYIRNIVELGNPLGYLQVQIGDITLLKGDMDGSILSKTVLLNVFNPFSLGHWKRLYNQFLLRLGIPYLVLLLSFIWLVISYVKGKLPIRSGTFWGLATVLITTFFLYISTPYSGANQGTGWKFTLWFGQAIRYGFPFLGILAVMAAVGLKTIRLPDKLAASLLTVILLPSFYRITFTVGMGYFIQRFTLIFLLLVWIGIIIRKNMQRTIKLIPLAVIAILTILSIGLIVSLESRDLSRNYVYGPIAEYIETEVPTDEVIGYIYSHRPYLFYGKHLDRKVRHAPALDAHDSPEKWIRYLEKKGIRYIATDPEPSGLTVYKERKWLKDPNGPFERVYHSESEKEPTIYRISSPNSPLK
jgi:hypothetical protein